MNISNLLIMTGDLNIRNNIWDSFFPHYSTFSNDLMTIADFFNLKLSFSTRYLDLDNKSNSVINFMFLRSRSIELNTYFNFSSDYISLSVSIIIIKENIGSFKFSIAKNSNEKISFIKDVLYTIKSINILDFSNSCKLKEVINSLTSRIELT